MIKQWLKAIALVSLLFTGLLPFGVTKTSAATVTISQTGTVVTATNGTLTISYDLSTGKGNFNAGATSIMSNFYSDYGVNGSPTRISSYDAGTRTATWATIGTDGYGTNGKKLTITNTSVILKALTSRLYRPANSDFTSHLQISSLRLMKSRRITSVAILVI
jgi:alpha-galactosidase